MSVRHLALGTVSLVANDAPSAALTLGCIVMRVVLARHIRPRRQHPPPPARPASPPGWSGVSLAGGPLSGG